MAACEALCATDAACSCFIHTPAPDPAGGFPACRLLGQRVESYHPTARGYSAWTKATATATAESVNVARARA